MATPFFIVGPTAVGKSSVALRLAERCKAEIVSADAFQIYAGFDLLTAKPSREERGKVPHHMIGIVPATETYNVARYLGEAQQCLASIWQRGKRAIVVGGTGLYIKALTHGLSPLPEGNPSLRAELDAFDAPTLFARLRSLDHVAAETIDRHNKRRLIRAVEVCLLTGKPFSSFRTQWEKPPSDPTLQGVFLVRAKPDLHERIHRRTETMFRDGAIEEVRAAQGTPISSTAASVIGLCEIHGYLSGRTTLSQCQELIALATRQYAKRQVTWFQREKCFEPVDLSVQPDEKALLDRLHERFLQVTETPLDEGIARN